MINTNINKQELPAEQREALLVVLHNRFEKNRNRHKDIDGLTYKQGWKLRRKNCGRSMIWKEPEGNRMSPVLTKRRVNTFFTIVRRKVRQAAGMFVTTGKGRSQGKQPDRKIMPSIWPRL